MKSIITIQHTQAIHHTNGMMGSWTDWELTDSGKEQAENIGKNLSAELYGQIYKIYSSDLIRAKQTAEPLARYIGIQIEFLDKLREHNIGEGVGKTRQWANENIRTVNSFDDPQFKGAETWREFWNRVEDLCRDIIADDAKNIVLVSHGGTLAVFHQVWLGADIQEFSRFGSPGGVSFMSVNENGGCIVQRLNDMSYIQGVTK